jgi:hypothetical protein
MALYAEREQWGETGPLLECPANMGDAKDRFLSARSGSREGTHCSDEVCEGDKPEPELANAKLPLQPPGNQHRIDCWREVGGHCNTSLEVDYRPPVPVDGGEQHEDASVVPPQAQESRSNMLSFPGDESDNERELANPDPSTQPSASQDQVNLQHNIGRPRCDADDKENRSPIVGRVAKQGKDEDIVRPPPNKRCRVNTSASKTQRTAGKRQTRPHCTDSQSLHAQRPPPTQGPGRRRSQRSISKQRSSVGSASGEDTAEAAFASFEEWPLEEAVLKRVSVDGKATFQLEFTWNPCTNHRRNDHTPETQRRKPPAGGTSSTGRALPSRVASTAEEVEDDGYFEVEDIWDWRQGDEEREYQVKWVGYEHKHNTWEPASNFDKCPEVLQQFHQRAGL